MNTIPFASAAELPAAADAPRFPTQTFEPFEPLTSWAEVQRPDAVLATSEA